MVALASNNSKTSLRNSITSKEVHETQQNQIDVSYLVRWGIDARALKLVRSRSLDFRFVTAKQQLLKVATLGAVGPGRSRFYAVATTNRKLEGKQHRERGQPSLHLYLA